jgi:predicted Zn-dependent protease
MDREKGSVGNYPFLIAKQSAFYAFSNILRVVQKWQKTFATIIVTKSLAYSVCVMFID